MAKEEKKYRNPRRKLERIVKGFANHWRLGILELLAQEPELSLDEITKRLGGQTPTIAVHVQKMAAAGLVMKRTSGSHVLHALTPRGKVALRAAKQLEATGS